MCGSLVAATLHAQVEKSGTDESSAQVEVLLQVARADPGDLDSLRRLAKQFQRAGTVNEAAYRQAITLWQAYRERFAAQFPLVRTLELLPFVGSESHYVVWCQPDRIAAQRAVSELAAYLDALHQRVPAIAPIDTVLSAQLGPTPRNHTPLSSKILAETALALDRLAAVRLTDVVRESTAGASPGTARHAPLLRVRLRRQSTANDREVLYQVTGELTRWGRLAQHEQVPLLTGDGVARDRREIRLAVVSWALVCLLLSNMTALGSRSPTGLSATRRLATANLMFLIGTASTVTAVMLVWKTIPERLAPVTLGFWWPFLFGCSLLAGPMFVFLAVRSQWPDLPVRLRLESTGRRTAVATSLGACAVLALPVLALPDISAWCFPAGASGAAAIAALAGGIVQKCRPFEMGLAFVLAGIWGLGLCQANVTVLAATAVAASAISLTAKISGRSTERRQHPSARESENSQLDALREQIALLPLGTSVVPDRVLEQVNDAWHTGRAFWLGIEGPAGSGKASTATALISYLQQLAAASEMAPPQILSISREPQDPPLEAVSRALNMQFPAAKANSPLANLVKVVADVALPTSVLSLLTAGDNSNTLAGEIQLLLERLREVTTRQPTVILANEAQRLDGSTWELIRRLQQQFVSAEQGPLVILTRQPLPHQVGGEVDYDVSLKMVPTPAHHLREMLTKHLSFEGRSADRIVAAIDLGLDERANQSRLPWLKAMVSQLITLNGIRRDDNQFCLTPEFLNDRLPPPPAEFQDHVEKRLQGLAPHRLLLQAAACAGRRFEAGTLADCLQRDRLEVLESLREIRETGQLVRELVSADQYEFTSEQTYNSVCAALEIVSLDASPEISHVQRELHARLAQAYLQRGQVDGQQVFLVARHCAAAGQPLAPEGLRYCLQAVGLATQGYAFDQAAHYLDLAARCAALGNQPFDRNYHALMLQCEQAHVTQHGELVIEAAARVRGQAHRQDPLFLLTAARACYDARKFLPQQAAEQYLEASIRFAERVIGSDTASAAQRAVGHQYFALGRSPSEAARTHLRRSRALVLQSAEPIDLLTRARVACALADELQRGPSPQPGLAREMYEESLALRRRHFPHDLAGLARVHGGLGRLLFETDVAAAREHFQQDLEISRRLGDRRGLTLMHSWLGRCGLREGHTSQALEHYSRSEHFAQNATDRLFMIIGNLRVASAVGTIEEVDRRGKQLVAWFQGEREQLTQIPPTARIELGAALAEARRRTNSSWVSAMNRLLPPRMPETKTRFDTPSPTKAPAFAASFRQLRAAFGPRKTPRIEPSRSSRPQRIKHRP